MMPADPITNFVIGKTCLTLCSLQTFFDAMLRFGCSAEFFQGSRNIRIAQIIIGLHDLEVPVSITDYDKNFLCCGRTTSLSSFDFSFNRLNDQWTLFCIMYFNLRPFFVFPFSHPSISSNGCTRLGGRPFPHHSAGGISKSRMVVLLGTANR